MPGVHPAVLEWAREQPQYSQAHEFIRTCCLGAVLPATVADMVSMRPRVRGPKPFDCDAPCWAFGDESVLQIWMMGRSHQRPQPCLETEDGHLRVQRWWVWWEGRWSSTEHAFNREPDITFEPIIELPRTNAEAAPDVYRILVNGRRAGEIVFDYEIRHWFLEAGSLLPPGGGGWLHGNTTRARYMAHRRLAHALLAHSAVQNVSSLP